MRLAANFGVRLLRVSVSGSPSSQQNKCCLSRLSSHQSWRSVGLSQRFKRHTKVKVSPIYRYVAKNPEGRTESNTWIQGIKHSLNTKWHRSANNLCLLLDTN